MRKALIAILLLFLVPSAFAETGYTRIDQETAKAMMAADDGHIIVDVRRQDEYDAGHIPGAILIPNESINSDSPEALPDYGQIILLYCRSGRRSKEAAQKLAGMGYTNIYEFGGIIDWTGEIVKTMKIKVSDGTNTITYQLNDSPPARSLYGMLPLDADVGNYGSNEKIFYPEQTIDTTDGIEGGGDAGDLALFSPWGNVVMYYGSFGSYPGLFILGEAVEGAEQVKDLSGTIHAEAVE